MKFPLAIFALASIPAALAQTAVTTPVGYTTVVCLPNSDTIVGLPLRIPAEGAAALTANPVVTGDFADLEVSSASFSSFAHTHYVKFKSGVANGSWYPITANTNNTITIDLNGAQLPAASGDQFEVIKFWTLGELFNPAEATTNPATTGNAIVASKSGIISGRMSELLIPNFSGVGINLATSASYFIYNGSWRKIGEPISVSFDDDQLWPDVYFTIRHYPAVTLPTRYIPCGEVETRNFSIPLATRNNGKQDNYVSIPRPIDVRLADLNLGGGPAFVSSTNGIVTGRKDELFLIDNSVSGKNKSASAIYFFLNGAWRRVGSPISEDRGNDILRAGSGLIIRKAAATTGTATWNINSLY